MLNETGVLPSQAGLTWEAFRRANITATRNQKRKTQVMAWYYSTVGLSGGLPGHLCFFLWIDSIKKARKG